jgi:hypothetical protein
MTTHGIRRAEEMEEVAETLGVSGVARWHCARTDRAVQRTIGWTLGLRSPAAGPRGALERPGNRKLMQDAKGMTADYRLPRPLHRAAPRRMTHGASSRRPPSRRAPARLSGDFRRRNPRDDREANQLRLIRERGADMTIFSPRASAMAPHVGDQRWRSWARRCNDLIARVVGLYPETFVGVCMLPQSPEADLTARSRNWSAA